VLMREHLARASETALYLVEDEEDVVLVAYLAHLLQEAIRRGHIPPFTEHGLNDDVRRVARGRLRQQQQLELIDGVHAALVVRELAAAVLRNGALRAVGEG